METAGRRDFLKQAFAGLGLTGVLGNHLDLPIGFHSRPTSLEKQLQKITQSMVRARDAFLTSLSPSQRTLAIHFFQNRYRQEWHYTPEPHRGITYKQLCQRQR